jgi:hypothetical protein
LASFFAVADKIQAEFAVFESIAGLINSLPHVKISVVRVTDVEQKIGVQGLTSWSWSNNFSVSSQHTTCQ